MIRLYPEQLATQLREGLCACYLLSGNEPLMLQESQDLIRQAAQQQQFSEHHSISLDAHTDWDAIFSICQAMSLFASRQTLLLMFPENGPTAPIGDQLIKLSALLHNDILLILRGPRLTKAQENSAWFKSLSPKAVCVSCQAPEQMQLPRWVAARAKLMKLELDNAANQLLCYCYEGNLLALSQALEKLSLLHPDGKLTLPRVEQAVNDAAHFTPFHWLDALLAGKSKRTWHILQQLQQEDVELTILLRILQRELLLLLTLQRRMASVPLRTLFDQHKVWQNRRNLMTQAVQRLSASQLQQAVQQLVQIELTLKQDYGQSVWPALETLSMLLCGKTLPASFTYGQ
ncbi:DNA polymerase III subunit delta [Serratia symbiotica]|uniref:DNA polymerase III subunit delta n=1 Tax=Serratia symbiotica TaxID=138074 RepID=UPI001323F97A|nr:DNA polymerase III subunit delta [Serratia symbiotica]MBF1994466.1 DNA polymerase III subunit delta [Serratia symbiotica]MBQ0956003.1 DNA polymerase III subunit delta [Serratia symbiotica]QTP15168.1 DNA polymerase III subunit delta [Serratia symbiotica]